MKAPKHGTLANLSAGIVCLAVVFFVNSEVAFVNGRNASIMFMAVTVACFIAAITWEIKMTRDDNTFIEVEIPGAKGRARGALGDKNLLVIAMFAVILFLQYQMLSSINRLIEATSENTYVLSLAPSEREKLSIVMPESLRRKLR